MFKIVMCLSVLAIIGMAGATGLGSVVYSFPVPDRAYGVACLGPEVWVCFDRTHIVRYTRQGSVVSSFPTGHTSSSSGLALAYSGRWYFWVGGKMNVAHLRSRIRQLRYPSGSFVRSFFSPNPDASYTGLTYGDGTLFVSDYTSRRIWRTTVTGYVLSSFTVLPSNPADLAFDARGGGRIWFPSSTNKRIHCATTAGDDLMSFDVSQYGMPLGCGFDGENVCVGFRLPSRIIAFSTGTTGVVSASFGKVKAMYK